MTTLQLVQQSKKKIKVTNSPNVLNDAVAEITIFLMLAAARRTGEGFNLVKSGNWKNQKPDITKFMVGHAVTGKTLGIIGMGRIGRIVAKRVKSFGMKVIYFNRNKLSNELEDGAKYYSDLKSMMPECDFVSIHTPATVETKNILNDINMKHKIFLPFAGCGSTINKSTMCFL